MRASTETAPTPSESAGTLVREAPDHEERGQASGPPAPSPPLPWSGRHLTVRDAWGLTALAPLRMIGVAGPYDAGKTSLLASLFLQIANGRTPGFDYRFAGCRTLHGFDRLVRQAAGYRGQPGDPTVDHTPIAESDDPSSFLHLALTPREGTDNRAREVLLSDVAGEWFTEWAAVDDAITRRRVPFLRRCDAILVLADSAKLLAEGSNSYDAHIANVLGRFLTFAREQPGFGSVWVVFTKLDLVAATLSLPLTQADARAAWGALGRRPRRIWAAVEALREDGVQVSVTGVSAFPGPLAQGHPYGVTELFGSVLGSAENPRAPAPTEPPPPGPTPFLQMRRERP